MAQPAVETPLHLSGAGWSAQVYVNHIVVHVSPDGDNLPDAIHALLAPTQRRLWVVQCLGEDDDAWCLYLLSRDADVTAW